MVGAKRLTVLARLQVDELIPERRIIDLRVGPAQLAALYGGARIFGILLRQLGKVGLAGLDVAQEAFEHLLGFLFTQDD